MIFVFKTNVDTEDQIKELSPHIDQLIPDSIWNFDLEDIDRIFRIECTIDITASIKQLFDRFNFHCDELE